MKEIKIGEYVRTDKGNIGRVISIDEDIDWIETTLDRGYVHPIIEFKKHSKNIIDLIEVGDYVNGKYVKECKNGYIMVGNGLDGFQLWERNIKSIVTKEQFKSMEYRLEEQ